MAQLNVLAVIEEAGTVAMEVAVDSAEISAGVPVTTPQVQIGTATVNGKPGTPLYFSGTISTTKAS